ncbi:MAG: hypothetical protein RMJ05_09340 [Thermomicrobium sp.]|nr:hypothetical protein [Thermomicrobium sp.]
MSQSRPLQTVYTHEAVRAFGGALRTALSLQQDFSSLVDLDGAERPDDFVEALKRFLRRFDALARRRQLWRPNDRHLADVIGLVDTYGVKVVRAAIISHALVAPSRRAAATEEASAEATEGEGDGVTES